MFGKSRDLRIQWYVFLFLLLFSLERLLPISGPLPQLPLSGTLLKSACPIQKFAPPTFRSTPDASVFKVYDSLFFTKIKYNMHKVQDYSALYNNNVDPATCEGCHFANMLKALALPHHFTFTYFVKC